MAVGRYDAFTTSQSLTTLRDTHPIIVVFDKEQRLHPCLLATVTFHTLQPQENTKCHYLANIIWNHSYWYVQKICLAVHFCTSCLLCYFVL